MPPMPHVSLATLSDEQRELLADVAFRAASRHAPEWLPDLAAAREEIDDALGPDAFSRVALDAEGNPIGYAAVKDQYGRLWELHPLVVDPDHQGRGHGRRLVAAIEEIVAERGGLVVWVGTSDETNATTLTGVDLYADPMGAIRSLAVHGRHSILFWQRVGYCIVGVAPDAEGHGRPSIHLAKRVGPRVEVRSERPEDAAAVRDVVVEAFTDSELGYGGEAELVDRLRERCEERIALVAEVSGRVVGYILFTPATIGDTVGVALGPMAIARDHQRTGIGTRLVSDGLGLARRRGLPFAIVLGHPAYYPRFGFERAVDLGVSCEIAGVPDDAFMVAVLAPDRRSELRGVARYHPAFSEGDSGRC
jgi:putative acetyltransferase